MTHSALIVGCGSIGERHLRCFLHTGRVKATGADTSPALRARIEQTYSVRVSPDWLAEVQSGKYDLAVICTPAPLHVEMAKRALEAGLHVLIEKPLSQSLAGVDELVPARDRSRRHVAVAYTFHSYPALQAVRAFIVENRFGPILHAVATSGQAFHRLRPGYAKTYYQDRQTGGGAIQDSLTHTANWMESVLGPTESVLCDCAHLAVPDVQVEDTVHIAARHAGGALCSYALNQFQAPNESYLQLNAADGSIRVELHRQRWGTFAAGASDWEWRPPATMSRDDPFIAQANAFLDQIEGRSAPLCSLEAGIQTLRFNLAALASAESGKRVACASVS